MALQRALRRVFAVVIAVAALATGTGTPSWHAQAHAQERGADRQDLFDEIVRRGEPLERTLRSVSASFVETSTSTLLKAPQTARGTLVAQRPNQVRLQYLGDTDARTVIVNGNTLALEWPARNMHGTRDIGGMMRRASRFFDARSPAELRKHFEIVAVVAPDRKNCWQVTFTPRRRQMREGVEKVHVWIDQTTLMLQALKMEYPGGDTRLMEFADVRINPPVAADAFTTPTTR